MKKLLTILCTFFCFSAFAQQGPIASQFNDFLLNEYNIDTTQIKVTASGFLTGDFWEAATENPYEFIQWQCPLHNIVWDDVYFHFWNTSEPANGTPASFNTYAIGAYADQGLATAFFIPKGNYGILLLQQPDICSNCLVGYKIKEM